MLRKSIATSLAVVVLVVAGFADEKAEPKKEAKVPTLKDLAWLTGTWVEAEKGSVFTEIWGAPQGDAMVAHDHWSIGGKTRMYEIVVIEQEKTGLVLKIRHFGRDLAPWPQEKDGPMAWPLKSLKGQSVVFEHPTREWPKRMEYHRKGDVLSGKLSGVENGKPNTIPFHFKLQ